jgi:hypothetical protein
MSPPLFRAVVDHIAVANRQPTAWEAGCYDAALYELAIGREKSARRKICLAPLPGAQQELPVSIIPCPRPWNCFRPLEQINASPNK